MISKKLNSAKGRLKILIIDIHTHLFPDALAEKALKRLVQNLQDYDPYYNPSAPYTDATMSGLAASAEAAGIDVCVVMPIATSPRPSSTLNDFATKVNSMPKFRSFGSVHPKSHDALHELERIRELGIRGIKLHPEYQKCYVDGAETVAVVRHAAQLGMWVLFHAGADAGMPPPVHGAPEHFARLRDAAPDAKIILAHMGAYRLWHQAVSLYRGLGFYADTSYSIDVHPEEQEIFAELIRILGADHVMFGTDSPWACQTTALKATKAFLSKYGFTANECSDILGGNAVRILDIKQECNQ